MHLTFLAKRKFRSVVQLPSRESGLVRWSSHDIYVSPSFAVEVVGVGEVSGSVWELGSECGSIDVSGVPVVPDVGVTALSAVMCGGVPSDSDFVEPQSFSFSKKRNFAYVEEQEDMNFEGLLLALKEG